MAVRQRQHNGRWRKRPALPRGMSRDSASLRYALNGSRFSGGVVTVRCGRRSVRLASSLRRMEATVQRVVGRLQSFSASVTKSAEAFKQFERVYTQKGN